MRICLSRRSLTELGINGKIKEYGDIRAVNYEQAQVAALQNFSVQRDVLKPRKLRPGNVVSEP